VQGQEEAGFRQGPALDQRPARPHLDLPPRTNSMNARERKLARDRASGVVKATWMADGTHWPGIWLDPAPDHASIV
jgi:hypothetical protein